MKRLFFILTILLFINFVNAEQTCQWGKSAIATSENSGSLAIYSLGIPDAPQKSCDTWSGVGVTWSPLNWNVKANLTINYDKSLSVSNLTVFGDYDMCWNGMWLKNSQTNQIKYVGNDFSRTCELTKTGENFFADTIILESCGWAWSSTDAVRICGETNQTTVPACGNNVLESGEECDDGNLINGDGCSSICKNEGQTNNSIDRPVYLILYLGDIDGSVSSSWHYAYNNLTKFYNDNGLHTSISFYPASMSTTTEYKNAIRDMYNSQTIDLIQKGYAGDASEANNDKLTYEQQKAIAKKGQDAYKTYMQNTLGISNAKLPTSYDLIQGKFTATTLNATKEIGFNQYFDLYYVDSIGPVAPTPTYDVIQYGISFTTNSGTGKETAYKNADEIYAEINNFTKYGRGDVVVKTINGTMVIPLWAHQQDFESLNGDSKINITKWNQYTSTVLALKNNPNVKFVTTKESYDLTHNNSTTPVCGNNVLESGEECDDGNLINGDGCSSICKREIITNETNICQYAQSASATSESSASLASYSVGTQNAPSVGNCGTWSGAGFAWTPSNWNIKGTLNLKYEKPIYANNLTLFGDYDACWSKITLKNSQSGTEKIILNSINNDCTYKQNLAGDFLADSISIESCGWSWSSVDAVQMCGKTSGNSTPVCGNNVLESGEECDDGNLINGDGCSSVCKREIITNETNICQYAQSATSTSQNTAGSLTQYSVGAPNAAQVGNCGIWSGYGYSWTPSNWDVIANLTLNYNQPVYANNLSIFGDYGMCWKQMWLSNSQTGTIKNIFNGQTTDCTYKQNLAGDFLADSIIIQTCGSDWSATDAVQMCGSSNGTVVNPVCGNNVLESGEECDDGNLINGDGCSSVCRREVNSLVEVCTWKNCKAGAASISMDDSFLSCEDQLNSAGLKGTYYLSDTSKLSTTQWSGINRIISEGHEVGTHTEEHWCIATNPENYYDEVERNINDIISNTPLTREQIISHAHPCGYTNENNNNALRSNWNFLSARGYNINLLEDSTPNDFFNLKSFNGYGYGPTSNKSYTELVSDAETQGKWASLVFHINCDDQGIISDLPNRDVWVDTIGNVVRYIDLRDNANITNYQETSGTIDFDISTDNQLQNSVYSEDLTLKISTSKTINSVQIDGVSTPFTQSGEVISFNVPFPIKHHVRAS
jgi:cysteine-rich repeat protein